MTNSKQSAPQATAPTATETPSSKTSLKTLKVADINRKYKSQGRTTLSGNGLRLDYTASSFEFNAYCAGRVVLNVNASGITALKGQGVYFTIVVDGVTQTRSRGWVSANESSQLVLAENLPEGGHSFQIFRGTEIQHGSVQIQSIVMNGTLSVPPAPRSLHIEFIGDSITAGFGNLTYSAITADSGLWAGSPVYQDGTQSYAFLTAENLDADISVIAQQGIGVVCGRYEPAMSQVYPYTRYLHDQQALWSFSRKADIVVINLGTNDMITYSAKGKTTADIQNGMIQLTRTVRSHYPDAAIIWAYGMMTDSANTLIQNTVSQLGGDISGYYGVALPKNQSGGDGHPDIAGHQAAATVLTSFIKNQVL